MMKSIDRLIDGVLAALLASTTLIVALGVFFRYILNDSLGWTDEISGYALGWISFIGAYSCFRKSSHLGFDVLLESLPPSAQHVLKWLNRQYAVRLLPADGLVLLARHHGCRRILHSLARHTARGFSCRPADLLYPYDARRGERLPLRRKKRQ